MSENHNANIFWAYWCSEKKKLKFSHDENMRIKMTNCPEVKMTSYSSSELYFIRNNLDLVAANVDGKSFEYISASVHNLDSIDSISGFKSKLFVWSGVEKAVSILAKQQREWVKIRDVSWLAKCEIFNITLDNEICRLMPVLKSGNEFNAEDYPVYAFKI